MKALVLLYLAGLIAQSPAAVFLSGAGSAEEMDPQSAGMFEHLARHPLQINHSSRSQLQASGLFTTYQIASLLDYRSHSGDILSYAELGRLDGWGVEFAQALREFTSLASDAVPGQSSGPGKWEGEATVRYGSSGYLGKLHIVRKRSLEAFFSSKTNQPGNASVAYYGRRWLGKIVIGSYNARFGQGLAKWSGMTMSGFNSIEALSRRPSGISVSTSTTPGDRGIAADFNFGGLTVSGAGALSISGNRLTLDGSANVNYCWKRGECGMTGLFRSGGQSISADFRCRAGNADLFGELSCELPGAAPAAILGLRMDPSYLHSWSIAARYYSPRYAGTSAAGPRSSGKTSDETGIAAAFKAGWLDGSADFCVHPSTRVLQAKALIHGAPRFSAGSLAILPSLRLAERFRPSDESAFRTDIRCDLGLEYGVWQANFRWNGLLCKDFAWLSYAEFGYKSDNCQLWLRGSLFKVDSWDDRIYVYERDVPGSFNVPACYGRGGRLSLTSAWSSRFRPGKPTHRFNIRAAATLYSNGKPATSEWRVQYSLNW